MSLALLVDEDPQFRPDQFVREKGGCRLTFTFPVVKLLSYRSEEDWETDPSPLAVASLVQLGKLRAGSDMERRLAIKLVLAGALYARGYDRERLLKLFRLLDYVLTLPEKLSRQFDRELEDIEETWNMPYVTSIERRARQEGIQQGQQEGMLQGVRELLQQTLQVRFGTSPESLLRKIEQCQDVAALRAVHQQALTVPSIDELQF